MNAFGDPRVFLEKYIVEPRHIEFQIMADSLGSVVHLFERECSIQRRHQKVIEEAPSAIMTEDLRTRMGKAAVDAARSCNYIGAGTVEFLVDKELNFYFMEMNTRLQVEHAVTEWITGLDLVREQIRIAEGRPLSFIQEDMAISGHAIECRIYAEDPNTDFLPGPGLLLRHHVPGGLGVRVDSGVEQGDDVSVHYDPMISKVTTWGASRLEAIQRMKRALSEYEIAGVPSTIPFCQFVLASKPFRDGMFSTHFVENHYEGTIRDAVDPELEEALARSARTIWQQKANSSTSSPTGAASGQGSNWRANRARKLGRSGRG
jgi:propionyl-CoA carboxylase alpha chain